MKSYNLSDWHNVKRKLSLGYSVRGCAFKTGVNRQTVFRWSHLVQPPDRLVTALSEDPIFSYAEKESRFLSFEQRAYIAALRKAGKSFTEIALEVGVHRTTVSRELKRCDKDPYDPRQAHLDYRKKARRPKQRKLDKNARLREYVVAKLDCRWSPEQIARKIAIDFPGDKDMRVSAETIYQSLYVQGKGALRQELAVEKALRSGRARRKPQSRLPKRARGCTWVQGCEISTRPPEVQDRAVPGHWEGDLIVGSDLKSCLVTLVERKTRFLIARRLLAHDTTTVVDLLIEMSAAIPDSIRESVAKSLTWDQGSELADAARFAQSTNFKVYFCDPHSPWQKGTNENTNGLIRDYFPKGTSFTKVTDDEVQTMQDQMNSRPRKTLGWRTPGEALAQELDNAKRATTV